MHNNSRLSEELHVANRLRKKVESMAVAFSGFAVFDLETTGFSPARHHRVIEIGIVRLDEDLEIVEEWETLINPGRDISASGVHGITASDLRDAPTFAELIGDIWHRFEGAIPVAHNFSFDKSFILSEFSRAGVEIGSFEGLCTMQLADRCGLTNGRLRLTDLCNDLGIQKRPAHSAGNDAWMSSELLRLAAKSLDLKQMASPVSCQELWKHQATPLGITRKKVRDTPIRSPLQLVSERLSSSSLKATADQGKLDEYLLSLDKVLEDHVVDPEETEELFALAAECGLSSDDVQQLHERYVANLAAFVLADGIVTEDERRDLNRVAGLLGVDSKAVSDALKSPTSISVTTTENFTGKTVCFTGDSKCSLDGDRISKSVAEQLIQSSGMISAKSVTKKLDILVVADPDSLSGKAKKARKYGTRIIAERSFWQKLGLPVD